MKNVILLTPLVGNGGIASWSRKFIHTFQSEDFKIIPVDRAVKGRAFEDNSVWHRLTAGLAEMRVIYKKVKVEIKKQDVAILHTTTSGSFGSFRDYIVSTLCRHHGIKTIMHCRYGCITEDVSNGVWGWFLRRTMRNFDQIWVLDNRSKNALQKIKGLEGKVFLTPNSIAVEPHLTIAPKTYRHVAFIANLVPSKGLFELLEAVIKLDNPEVRLSIVGTGSEDVISKVKSMAQDRLNKTIFMLGQLPNDRAVEFLKSVDILALPTYMPAEAFPISILEAMSHGKLVISTRRAAIADMLTGLDGRPCGIFVREQSVDDIAEAISWCLKNPREADKLCVGAYNKVYTNYRMEVVYQLYATQYRTILTQC